MKMIKEISKEQYEYNLFRIKNYLEHVKRLRKQNEIYLSKTNQKKQGEE